METPVKRSALDTYLVGVEALAAPLVVALDETIRSAHPDFDAAVKYQILMYALGGAWRTWVFAIDATKKGVGLRFLYGVLLDDPQGVLRAGASVLKTWNFGFADVVDPAADRPPGRRLTETCGRLSAPRPGNGDGGGPAR